MENKKEIKIFPVTGGIYTIETHYLDRENYAACYLMEQDGEVAIIETNTNYAVPTILGALEHLGFSEEQVKYVILTHIHLDHAGGAGQLMQHLSKARLILHPRARKHMINPEKLIQAVKDVYGEAKYIELYGEIQPIDKDRVQTVEDKESILLGSRELQMFHMNGHAKHHITIWDKQSASVFSGDNFGIGYPHFIYNHARLLFPSTSPTQFEPEAALETYEQILELNPSRILLTHFGAIEDIEGGYVQLKNWIHFAMEISAKRYAEGLRGESLSTQLQEDVWNHFEKEVSGARGFSLTPEEKELLEIDADLNAQGMAHYIEKLNAKED